MEEKLINNVKDLAKLYKITNGYFKFIEWQDGISKLEFVENKIPPNLKDEYIRRKKEYINNLVELDYFNCSKEQKNSIEEKVFFQMIVDLGLTDVYNIEDFRSHIIEYKMRSDKMLINIIIVSIIVIVIVIYTLKLR